MVDFLKVIVKLLRQLFGHFLDYGKQDRDLFQWRYKTESLSEEEVLKAIVACTIILEKKPEHYMTVAARAKLNYHTKNYESAIIDFDRAIKLMPNIGDLYFERGMTHLYLNENQNAIHDFTHAIDIDQGFAAKARMIRGIIYHIEKDYPAALADFERSIAENNDSYFGYEYCASTYVQLGDYEKAISYYDRAILLKQNPRLYKLRAEAHRLASQFDKALSDLEEVIRLEADNPENYYLRARLYSNSGQYADANADLNFAVSLEPDNVGYLMSRGRNHIRLHRYDDAEADLNRVAELQPESVDLYIYKGYLASHRNQFQEATTFYEKALALENDTLYAINNLGYLHYRLGDHERAFDYLDKATLLDQNWPYIYVTRGYIYFDQEKYEEAKSQFEKAVELSSSPQDGIAGLAITHHVLGEYAEAKTLWQQLVDKDERYLDVDWIIDELLWLESIDSEVRKLIAKFEENDEGEAGNK